MNIALDSVFLLFVLFQLKHFVADFPLQREYMLRKDSSGWEFALPLGVHCLVHASICLVILLIFAPSLWWLAFLDFTIHFIMDRLKSGPKYLGRFNDKSKPGFWNAMGFDQMVHHCTHYFIIWVMLTSGG